MIIAIAILGFLIVILKFLLFKKQIEINELYDDRIHSLEAKVEALLLKEKYEERKIGKE